MPLIDAICCRAFSRANRERAITRRIARIYRSREKPIWPGESEQGERETATGRRERERETRDRPLALARRSPASGSSSSSSGAPENRFSPLLESQAFARKRIPLIKRESRRTLRSYTWHTGLSVRADVTIGRLFLAMHARREAAIRASRTREPRVITYDRADNPPIARIMPRLLFANVAK